MKCLFKQIKKQIKKYDNIVIARHIGADPDALGSQFALKELINNYYPKKKVYAVGAVSYRFRFMGNLDKLEEVPKNALLIVLDTPDAKRIDGACVSSYDYVIKIDHHPFIERYASLEYIDDSACSTCQIVLEFINKMRYKITKSIASNLYLGIVADTNRFLHDYTSSKTFKLVSDLISKTDLDFISTYKNLYNRPLNEVRFQGYIYQNLHLTDNRVAYIKISDSCLKEFGVDVASAGNMINDLNYINEVLVWVFFSEDVKNGIIKANIRSRGPVINDVASLYGGGGHKYASGARLKSFEEADCLIEDLDRAACVYLNEEGM